MTSVFEEKNIAKAILRVGFPAMLGQLTTLIYNIADTFFVSMTGEPAMIAAVTLCAPVLLIIMSIACIFGMGGSSVIARLLGEDRKKEAGIIFNFCTYSMAIAGIVTLVIGLVFVNKIGTLIGTDSENFEYTCDYLRFIFVGAPFIMLANGFVHLFRSAGLIKESTIGLILGNIINIVLDFVFIVLLGLGTCGAALATSVGFLCSTTYYVICIICKEKEKTDIIRMSLKNFKPNVSRIKNVISIGIPAALITVLMSVSNIVLNNYIGIYGSDAVASYGIAYKINMVPIMLSVGLSQGVTPLIGYYYGADKKNNMTKAMSCSILYEVLLGTFFLITYYILNKQLSAIFLHNDDLVSQAGYFLRILCISAPLLGVINMVTNYFQALGKAIQSLVITLMRNVILLIPMIILFNYLFGLNGVIAAQPFVEAILMVLCVVMYIRDLKCSKKA